MVNKPRSAARTKKSTGTGDVKPDLIALIFNNNVQGAASVLRADQFAKNTTDYATGDTPLHIATRLGNVRMVKLLLGYDPHALQPNKRGETPLDLALTGISSEVRKLLLRYSARRLGLDEDGWDADKVVQLRPR